jgi:hypothetical protein
VRVASDQLAREHGADSPIDVPDLLQQLDLLATIERRAALFDEPHVERFLETMVLRLDMAAAPLRAALSPRAGCG